MTCLQSAAGNTPEASSMFRDENASEVRGFAGRSPRTRLLANVRVADDPEVKCRERVYQSQEGLPLSVQMASARPQRRHRVDAGGAARGEITCEGGDGCQQNEHARKSGWVSGSYAEEEAADGASESPGRGNSDE